MCNIQIHELFIFGYDILEGYKKPNKILIETSSKLVQAELTPLEIHPKHTEKSTTVCTFDTCNCKAPSISIFSASLRQETSSKHKRYVSFQWYKTQDFECVIEYYISYF